MVAIVIISKRRMKASTILMLVLSLSCACRLFPVVGKTAIRTLLSPQYQKLKKVPAIKDEDEAKALMVKLLPL